MEIVTVNKINAEGFSHITMKKLFDETLFKEARTTFGKVVIPPGARVPLKDMGTHDEDEYSIIIQGSLQVNSGGKNYRVSNGQAIYIPMNEQHYSYNDRDEDCIIIYSLVKR